MSHRVKPLGPMPEPPVIDEELAYAVAMTSQALGNPSRVRILARLWRGPTSVSELALEVGMEQSALSHQLRVLRQLGLVRVRRDGRSAVYSLMDDHVAVMLNEAIYHVEHVRLAGPGLARAGPDDE